MVFYVGTEIKKRERENLKVLFKRECAKCAIIAMSIESMG
jgi:hypothetical protein